MDAFSWSYSSGGTRDIPGGEAICYDVVPLAGKRFCSDEVSLLKEGIRSASVLKEGIHLTQPQRNDYRRQ